MLPNSRGFYEGNKFNLVVDHQSLKISLLTHMLSKSSLPQLIRKLTTKHIFLSNFSSTPKPVKSCATKPERVCEIPLNFLAPNTILLTSILSKYPKLPSHSPPFHHLLKFIILILSSPKKNHPPRRPPKTSSLSFFSLSNGSCGNPSLQSMASSSFKNQ